MPWRRLVEYGALAVIGIGAGLGLAWARREFGWPRAAVEWGMLAVGLAVLAYAAYAAYGYYKALQEEDEDF